jgi:sporulation protein YlmC with PRC-barrel domain
MKSVYLASVLALVLGASAAYSATPATATAKDGVPVQSSAAVQHETQVQADAPYNDGSYESIPDYTAEANDTEATKDLKKGLRKADNAMRETADDIRAFFVGDEGGGALEPVMIRSDRTAKGLLDKPVLNPQGKEITKLKDIIIDQNGRAALVVVSDGGFLGIGKKLAAFDYNKVVAQQDDGKVIMALSPGHDRPCR